MSYLLHVVPGSLGNRRKAFAGSTKDVIGRSEYFNERGVPVRELVSPDRSDADVLAQLRGLDLSGCEAVFFEYETYLDSMRFLAYRHPRIRRIVRAHNANLPHFADQLQGRQRMLADGNLVPHTALFDDARQALQRFALDRACGELAHLLLPISGWESLHYWGRLAVPAKVATLPYFVPRSVIGTQPPAHKRDLLVFMMGVGGAMTPLLYDAGRNAVDLVNALDPGAAPSWRFAITGRIRPAELLGTSSRMEQTGLLDSPLGILAQARAVAILSDLGMGFKTKLLEAAMAGCWLLVTPGLLARVPAILRPWCLTVDPCAPGQFEQRLRECARQAPPPGDPNQALRADAFATLDAVVGSLFHRADQVNSIQPRRSVC